MKGLRSPALLPPPASAGENSRVPTSSAVRRRPGSRTVRGARQASSLTICTSRQSAATSRPCSSGNQATSRAAAAPSRTIKPPGANTAKKPMSQAEALHADRNHRRDARLWGDRVDHSEKGQAVHRPEQSIGREGGPHRHCSGPEPNGGPESIDRSFDLRNKSGRPACDRQEETEHDHRPEADRPERPDSGPVSRSRRSWSDSGCGANPTRASKVQEAMVMISSRPRLAGPPLPVGPPGLPVPLGDRGSRRPPAAIGRPRRATRSGLPGESAA